MKIIHSKTVVESVKKFKDRFADSYQVGGIVDEFEAITHKRNSKRVFKLVAELKEFAERLGVTVNYSNLEGLLGITSNQVITLDEDIFEDSHTVLRVFLHELAHCLIHFKPDGKPLIGYRKCETEAEYCAFILMESFGIDVGFSIVSRIHRMGARFSKEASKIPSFLRSI